MMSRLAQADLTDARRLATPAPSSDAVGTMTSHQRNPNLTASLPTTQPCMDIHPALAKNAAHRAHTTSRHRQTGSTMDRARMMGTASETATQASAFPQCVKQMESKQ